MQETLLDSDERHLSKDVPTVVKWAGGKQQLLPQYEKYFPSDINTYFEPFLGGAAVLFFVRRNGLADEAVGSDVNAGLIETFKVLREQPDDLMDALEELRDNHSEVEYYKERGLKTSKTGELGIADDELRDPENMTPLRRAARFIYLNKTCYNGLYRENNDGRFNVPMGDYDNPSVFSEDTLSEAAELLQDVDLRHSSYEYVEDEAKQGDLVYFDPPYVPLNETSDFTDYNEDGFGPADQRDLRDIAVTLHEKGCYVLLSNSSADLVEELYDDTPFERHEVHAARHINSDGDNRDGVTEYLLSNVDLV